MVFVIVFSLASQGKELAARDLIPAREAQREGNIKMRCLKAHLHPSLPKTHTVGVFPLWVSSSN